MNIEIHKLDARRLAEEPGPYAYNGAFNVESRLSITLQESHLSYSIVPTSPYQKIYPLDAVDWSSYTSAPERAIYRAYADGVPAGEIRLRRYWNNLAYIDDIVVDAAHRRMGLGRRLMGQAAAWAKEQGLAGVMLETQDINVAGCQLYQSCGFELGGFDRRLYQGVMPGTDEVALFWYLIF